MNDGLHRTERWVIALALWAALFARLAFLFGPLDEVSWRQAETAYMTLRLAEESPPQVLHSKVPYRGAKDVHLAELPVYPLTTALVYKALGRESLPAARLVCLAFFAGAVVYLFRAVVLFFDRRTAWLTAAVYALLPLGVFYARAVHPDFALVFFCHGFFYHALVAYERRRRRSWWMAMGMLCLVFLTKAPYGFYFGLPLAAFVLSRREGWRVRTLASMAGLYVLPLLLGWLYNEHRIALEADEVESLVYPMRWTHAMTRDWFFGDLAQRIDPAAWGRVLRRAFWLVLTPAGVFCAAAAFLTGYRREQRRGWWTAWAWAGGTLLYVLVVFFHVSSQHDYYSVPLLAPAALFTALFAADWCRAGSGVRGGARLALVLVLVGAGSAYGLRRGGYFRHDWQRLEAGRMIARETRPDDLVVSITQGRSTGWSDPRILTFAHRRGWAIERGQLNEAALALYRGAGADVAALLLTPAYDPDQETYPLLESFPRVRRELRDPEGRRIGWLLLFDLREVPAQGGG